MRIRTALAIALLALSACSNGSSGTAPATSAQSEIEGTPAPGSKFSRIQLGMSRRQVEDLIGQPNDQNAHITGKAFIPFYFGGDTSEIDTHYKGEGILTYGQRNFGSTSYDLVHIKVDPMESGYDK